MGVFEILVKNWKTVTSNLKDFLNLMKICITINAFYIIFYIIIFIKILYYNLLICSSIFDILFKQA